MSSTELTSKVRELKELKQMFEELATEIETIQDAIKAEMTARNTDTMLVDVFKVTWKSVTSTRLDAKALKAECADIYNRYAKTIESRRFTIA